ncbi:hypothetical protein NQ317_012108 [Molorchus minor]|uniref:Uncharacterized protein n=1 Tax=Molorchus minor TaxID=1323400 RepID=A0ABQ9J1D9_9CUCU|nr:hypothetical protein NQ317_012108 [Molorchus minor]
MEIRLSVIKSSILAQNVKHLRKQCLKIAIEMVLCLLFCIENGPVTSKENYKIGVKKNKMLVSNKPGMYLSSSNHFEMVEGDVSASFRFKFCFSISSGWFLSGDGKSVSSVRDLISDSDSDVSSLILKMASNAVEVEGSGFSYKGQNHQGDEFGNVKFCKNNHVIEIQKIEKSSKKLHLLKIQFRLRFKSESIKLSHSNHYYNY